jgi:hypothetical protein
MPLAAAAVACALTGQGYGVTALITLMFLVCFNVAFGRRSLLAEAADLLARRSHADG